MISLASALILLVLSVSLGHSLVHFMQLQSGGKKGGCIGKSGKPIPVGGWEKDENTCGVYVCQNNDGVALIHYCQSPASFQECEDDGVSTVLPFPECCWICVDYADCDSEDQEDEGKRVKAGDTGETPKKGGGDESPQKPAENPEGTQGAEKQGTDGTNTDASSVANANKSKRKYKYKLH